MSKYHYNKQISDLAAENLRLRDENLKLREELRRPTLDTVMLEARALHFLKRAGREWGRVSLQSKKVFHSSIGAAIAIASIIATSEDENQE